MQIIRDRRIGESRWQHVPEGSLTGTSLIEDGEAIIVGLADWRDNRAELLGRNPPVGVRLGAGDSIDEIVGDLAAISLVALEFAGVGEGRGYSQARLLREHHGFAGEIRAVGDVSRDRLAFMQRCGFNAYELRPGSDLQDALKAFGEISAHYQSAADEHQPISAERA
jgi:uncharacterized protein (DUF934 family)